MDPLGVEPFLKYNPVNASMQVKIDLMKLNYGNVDKAVLSNHVKNALAIVSDGNSEVGHIQNVNNENILQSVAKLDRIREFTTTKRITENDTFELFDQPWRILDADPNYIEFNPDGTRKNSNASVILYYDKDVSNNIKSNDFLTESGTGKISLDQNNKLSMTYWMMYYINFKKGIRVTDYIVDRRSNRVSGFVDPASGVKFQTCDPDYYGRKRLVDYLYSMHGTQECKWMNQTAQQIAVLIANVNKCFFKVTGLYSNLSQRL